MNKQIKVFHHNDPDGYCSQYWFSYFHQKYFSEDQVDYEEYNYTKIEKIEDINNQFVYFLDCSPENRSDMAKLKAQGNTIIIIDHHETAYDKYQDEENVVLFYDNDHSGCEQTRIYFAEKYNHSFEEWEIRFSKLIEDWDIWKFEFPETEAFVFGIQTKDIKDMGLWQLIHQDDSWVDDYINKGADIISFRNSMAQIAINRTGREIDFHGFRCYALNNALPSSKWFLEKAHEYDCMLNWCVNKYGKVSASLYSEYPNKIHAGKLLEKHYGGGGHAGAAGCTIDMNRFFKEILKEKV